MEDVSAQAIEDVSVWDTHFALKPAAAVYKNLVINPSDANQPESIPVIQPVISGNPKKFLTFIISSTKTINQ